MPDSPDELAEQLARPPSPTRRPTVAALEEQLFRPIRVLDHGFVRLVDYMGDDAAIVQAARVSYGAGTKAVRDDRGLIRYLMRHRHSTPFEMCEIKLHVKLPIFVARQWIRHRTASVNEYSARYSILDREFYLPSASDLAIQSSTNRQGREQPLDPDQAALVLELLRGDAMRAYGTYETLLNDRGDGTPVDPEAPRLARELARMNLNLSWYTQWYWKIDLHNLFHFLSLRMDPHAQHEIRVYADAIGGLAQAWAPAAYEAFADYRLHGAFFSREEVSILKAAVAGGEVDRHIDASGLSAREKRELRDKLGVGPA
ncbi:MAG: FAD-dependent thymidylate synthase [Deltaproteobacteria bacterium]|nr:FAD-dependent thymidylate synthase [Deltaproteobacteria bacterium]